MSYLHAAGHRLEYRWIHPRARAPGRPSNAMPVLVFLHEGLGSVALWKNFPELVAEATGCSALVYSRYGYGKSDRLTEPRAIDYLHREALESLPQVLDELSIHNPVLIGHSDGASIALIYSSSGVAEALVLIAPHVFVEDCTVASIRDSGTAFETTDMKVKLARYHADPASTFWGWNEIWLRPEFRRWNIEGYLPCVQCPVLLIQCEDDPYGSLAQIAAIERQVSGPVEMRILRKGAHSPHLRQKQKTVREVAGFIRRIRDQHFLRTPSEPAGI